MRLRITPERLREMHSRGLGYTVLHGGILRFALPLFVAVVIADVIWSLTNGVLDLRRMLHHAGFTLVSALLIPGPLWGFYVWSVAERYPSTPSTESYPAEQRAERDVRPGT